MTTAPDHMPQPEPKREPKPDVLAMPLPGETGGFEALSALADGGLTPVESSQALQDCLQDDEARLTWHAYHVIGDVLRDADLAPSPRELDFAARLQLALAQEPLPQVPQSLPTDREELAMPTRQDAGALLQAEPPLVKVALGKPLKSANADLFRWKMVAAVATLGLGVVLALGLKGEGNGTAQERLASGGEPALILPSATQPGAGAQQWAANAADGAGAEEAVMLRNPELDALLQAHQQMGGHSALQMPSGFLRNATFERSPR